MRVLVCGDRNMKDYAKLKEVLSEFHTIDGHKIDCIISGHARGADTLGEQFADEHNIPKEIYLADWDKYGKTAGPIRNKEMLDKGRIGLVIAFLAENSKGTKNMIEQSIKAGKPTKVVLI